MSLGHTGEGFHTAPAYLVSAMPWVTGTLATTTTPQRLDFPKVTKYVKVNNVSGSDVRVGFSNNGIQGTNFFRVPAGQVLEFDVRVKELYLMSDTGTSEVDVFAGLTLVDKRSTGFLTGSTGFSAQSPGSGWEGVG